MVTPPKMTQIIIKNHKKVIFFLHSIKINHRVLERPPMKIFFPVFFSVTRDLIDHFGEEIVWLPFFPD